MIELKARLAAPKSRIRKAPQVQKEIQEKENAANLKIDEDVRKALEKVAKEKGANLVFSHQVVYYADIDITKDVVTQLNK